MIEDKYTQDLQRKIKKLPQWVQAHINRLERDKARYKEILTQTEAGQTPVSWTDYTNEKYLPERGVVRYNLSGGPIEISVKNDNIEVRSNAEFGNVLVILPAYSNCFYATILKPSYEADK